MQLDFNNYQNKYWNKYENKFNDLMEFTFKFLKIKHNFLIEVDIVSSKRIRTINKEYRNIDRPTDVISFALLDGVDINNIDKKIPTLLGEIFISTNRVISQAKKYCHSEEREICFLFVHGLLHLLGYDHMTKEDEEVMFNLQKKILKEFEING